MKTLYKRTIEARELPAAWREEGQFAPDDRVTIWVEPEDPELAEAASLGEIMNIIGRRMQERGLLLSPSGLTRGPIPQPTRQRRCGHGSSGQARG